MSNSVTAAVVREAFRSGALDPKTVKDDKGNVVPAVSIFGADGTGEKVRGRLHPAFIAAYAAAYPGAEYVATAKGQSGKSEPERMITLKVFKTDAKGRKRPRKDVEVPISEARRLAGVSRGRFTDKTAEKAAAAYMEANGLG